MVGAQAELDIAGYITLPVTVVQALEDTQAMGEMATHTLLEQEMVLVVVAVAVAVAAVHLAEAPEAAEV
jgi:hypothetical protein